MGYKDKGKQREYDKERMRKKRVEQKMGRTEGVEQVPAAYIIGNKGVYEFLPERPRFLELSDGQILDRLNPPEAKKGLKGMLACNDAYFGEMEGQREAFQGLKEKYAVK